MPHTKPARAGRLGIPSVGRRMIVPALLAVALLAGAEWQLREHVREHQRTVVLEQLATLRAELEGAITANLLLVRGLIAAIALEPEMDQTRFSQLAGELMRGDDLLRNIAAAPDLVISLMHPMAGNEAAIGLDFRNHPEQRQAALEVIETGRIVVAGPLPLVQGGIGLVARAPVHTADPSAASGRRLWGLVSSVIDIDRLYRRVGLDREYPQMRIALRGRDARGAEGEVFHGDPDLFEHAPLTLDVSLPHGSWQLGAIPRGDGGAMTAEHWLTRLATLLIVSLALLLAYLRGQRDVERAQIAEELALNEERFRATFEQAAVGIAHLAPDGRWLRVNQKLCDIVGYGHDELLRLSFQEITHPDDLEADLQLGQRMLAGEISHYQTTKRYIRSSGEPIWVNLTVSLVRAKDGRPLNFISVIEDISERVQTERDLRASEERFSRFMDHLPSGAFIVQPDSGRLVYFNRWLREHGGEKVQFDAAPEEFFDAQTAQRHQAENRQVLEHGRARVQETLPAVDGRLMQLETLRFLIPQQDGGPLIGGIISDISERVAAQQALHTSEAQLRAVLATIPDTVFVKDLDGVYRQTNRQMERLLDLPGAKIRGKTDYDLFDADKAEEFRDKDRQVIATGTTLRFEEWVRRGRDGAMELVETLKAPMRDDRDRVIGVLGVARMITERRRMEAALAENEARFRTIFEQAGVGVALVDSDSGRFRRVNQRYADILGLEIDQIEGRLGYGDITHADDLEHQTALLERLRAREPSQFSLEHRCRHREGHQVWVNLTASAVESALAEAAPQHIAIIEDISERKQALAGLELKQFMVDHMGDASFLINEDGYLLDVNQEACRSLEYDRADLLRMAVWEVSANLTEAQWPATRERVRANRHLTYETAHRSRSGRVFPIEISVNLFVYDGVEYLVALARDISERRRAEEMLREAHEELECRVLERTAELTAANQELESFTYAVSHDLRTPLRAIQGFQQALVEDLGGRLPAEALDYLHEIDLGSKKMGRLINGLLELSRSTRSDLQRATVDLGRVAGEIHARLAQLHPGREVRLTLRGNLSVQGDRNMLYTLLQNLIVNAWTYTGGRPRAEIVLKRGPGVIPVFCIEDNGVGFDMAYADKLFLPFHRLHRDDEFPGIGIGLATVQRIVRRHGGWIHGEGETGKGARFCFTLVPDEPSR